MSRYDATVQQVQPKGGFLMKRPRQPGFGISAHLALLTLTLAIPASAAEPPATTPTPPLCANVTPSCGSNCSNTPFELTDCWTTPYGPARADVVVVPAGAKPVATQSPNMLACQGGGYALCFFSGPPSPIVKGGQALPCVLGPDGLVADCTCQYYSASTKPYYVDINGILNQGAYFEAVKQCGADGSGCSNIAASSATTANVCNYINSQPQGDPATSFYPKDAQIISTFSFAMTPMYPLSSNPTACNGQYAGCMTAPCRFADGSSPSSHKDGDPIQCQCPVYIGDYQIGAANQTSCTIPSSDGKTYVWSASNTVVAAPAAASAE